MSDGVAGLARRLVIGRKRDGRSLRHRALVLTNPAAQLIRVDAALAPQLGHRHAGFPSRQNQLVTGRLRQECLNANWFISLNDAKAKIAAWRTYSNESRPHSAHWATPTELARRCGPQAIAGAGSS